MPSAEQTVILTRSWKEFSVDGVSPGLRRRRPQRAFSDGAAGRRRGDHGARPSPTSAWTPELPPPRRRLQPDADRRRGLKSTAKGDLTVKVVDAAGKPVPNATRQGDADAPCVFVRLQLLWPEPRRHVARAEGVPGPSSPRCSITPRCPFTGARLRDTQGKPDYARLQTMAAVVRRARHHAQRSSAGLA